MSKNVTTVLSTLLVRLRSFLQDFLPANNLQTLFPLASLMLCVGASDPWLPPRQVLFNVQYQHQDGTLWFEVSTRFLLLRYYAILYAVQFGFLGSLALWCLPVRNLWRKFTGWMLLPGGLAVTWFTVIVLLSRPQPPSILESSGQILQDDLHPFLGRLLQLGTGFYITLLGMALCAVALRVAAIRSVPLPIRFRGSARPPQWAAKDEKAAPRLFVLIVVTKLVAAVIEMGIFVPRGRCTEHPFLGTTPGRTFCRLAVASRTSRRLGRRRLHHSPIAPGRTDGHASAKAFYSLISSRCDLGAALDSSRPPTYLEGAIYVLHAFIKRAI